MKSPGPWVTLIITGSLTIFLLGSPAEIRAQTESSTPPPAQSVPPSAAPAPASDASLPDSPGAVQAQATAPAPVSQTSAPQAAPSKPKPAGTAAAEISNPSGVTASKPAGVAIAPARQRRARSFLIKMGAVMGAAAAVGAVMALSSGSPSKPPGAR